MLSNEWWNILHATLKTATELNIEIGIFNSLGWSQSGDSWMKGDAAMRYLTASELHVKGPLKYHGNSLYSGRKGKRCERKWRKRFKSEWCEINKE